MEFVNVLDETGLQSAQPQIFDPVASDDGAVKFAAFRNAQRHSRRVSVLKFVLPLAAILIATGFFAYSYAVTPAKVSLDVADSAISDGKLVMASPKLEGFTKLNKPYSMTALRAYQDLTKPGLIELEDVSAKLPYDEENFATIEASHGFYDQQANTLQLENGLTVTTTDGMSVKLNTAHIDIAKGNLKTDLPVDIQLKGSRIQADSMSIQDQGQRMVFDKRVRMVVEPRDASLQKADGS
ncbi:MAG: LPS export ABC transporter periplasmic protein LptC [Rhizobiaceae bacterium]|nr:LPS export ABC transporter periplasmic protein LptC [Rhizobiaceae bacterium]